MTQRIASSEIVRLAKGLEENLQSAIVGLPPSAIVDIVDVYAACAALMASVEVLATATATGEARLRALVAFETWAYGELNQHLTRLRAPLGVAIERFKLV